MKLTIRLVVGLRGRPLISKSRKLTNKKEQIAINQISLRFQKSFLKFAFLD